MRDWEVVRRPAGDSAIEKSGCESRILRLEVTGCPPGAPVWKEHFLRSRNLRQYVALGHQFGGGHTIFPWGSGTPFPTQSVCSAWAPNPEVLVSAWAKLSTTPGCSYHDVAMPCLEVREASLLSHTCFHFHMHDFPLRHPTELNYVKPCTQSWGYREKLRNLEGAVILESHNSTDYILEHLIWSGKQIQGGFLAEVIPKYGLKDQRRISLAKNMQRADVADILEFCQIIAYTPFFDLKAYLPYSYAKCYGGSSTPSSRDGASDSA